MYPPRPRVTLTQDAIRYFVGTVNGMELTEDNMEFYVD